MRILILLSLLLTTFGVTAQDAAGIDFSEKSFEELLAEAKEEDKLVFIDAYTTWCGPCKMMSAKVFPRAEVGEVYNARFVNAKIDMEKGEGPALQSRYQVMGYPTYLFLNGDGELVHKGMGYIAAERFIALGEAATSDRSMGAMGKRYDDGEREAAFVSEYIAVLNEVYEKDRAEAVTNEYLTGLDKAEWATDGVRQMIVANPGELAGDRFQYLLNNYEDFMESTTTATLTRAVQNTVIGSYMQEKMQRKLPEPDQINAYYDEHAAPLAEQLKLNYAMIYSERMDRDNYPAAAVAYLNRYPSNDATELNGVAWHFYENVDDPNLLKTAVGWAMRSVSLHKMYANLDTLAWLHQKMGNTKQAKKHAREAIEVAKIHGEDYSSTLPILEE